MQPIEEQKRTCDTVRTMILIRNAKIVDGTGAPERHGDVLVSGKSISAIGNFHHKKTETAIDALGHRLVPGFVDLRSPAHRTLAVFENENQAAARADGFTTLVGGTDGTSLAPVVAGPPEDSEKWGTARTNVDWRTMGEFRHAFGRVPHAANFATFAGYNTVRRAVLHETGGDPTDKEQSVMLDILDGALREGALGIAMNLDTAHGRRISHAEVRHAAGLCAARGVPFILRPRAWTEHFMEAANEAVALYRTTGARMVIADVLPHGLNKAAEKDFRLAYAALGNAGDGLFMEVRYGMERHVPLYELLPRFARVGTLGLMRALISDRGQRKRIMGELPRLEGARIVRTVREHAALVGASLESFAANRGMSAKDALLELMRLTGLRATIAIPSAPSPLHIELMKDPRILISGEPHAALAAADAALLPLEAAVMKLSGQPATVLGFAKRGMICENYAADLVLMDDRGAVLRTVVNGAVDGTGGICIGRE